MTRWRSLNPFASLSGRTVQIDLRHERVLRRRKHREPSSTAELDLASFVPARPTAVNDQLATPGDVLERVTDGSQVAFWRAQLRLSFTVLGCETAVLMVYLGATPGGRDRTAIWTIASVFLGLGFVGWLVAPHVAAKTLRLPFSFAWTIATVIAIAVVTVLDGGLASPLRSLLIIPVVVAGLVFPPIQVTTTGFAAIVAATVVTVVDPGVGVQWPFVFIDFAVLIAVAVCSIFASVGRTRMRHEAAWLTDQLAALATTDTLTGCLTRRAYEERTRSEVARALRYDRPLSFMIVDADNFKRINDTQGHISGDQALVKIADVLLRTSRAADAVGRLGGDEFAVLMPDTEVDGAIIRAQRIGAELRSGDGPVLTLSCGVSVLGAEVATIVDLYAAADSALYAGKRAGGDVVVVPSEGDAFNVFHLFSADRSVNVTSRKAAG